METTLAVSTWSSPFFKQSQCQASASAINSLGHVTPCRRLPASCMKSPAKVPASMGHLHFNPLYWTQTIQSSSLDCKRTGQPCALMTEQFIISPQLGIPGPPEYLQVFNTSFTYINIQWTPPRCFFDSPKSGYIVKIETLGDPNIEVRLIYSSCHSEGINITDLEEYTKYCVYVTTFNEYGKANSSSCIVAVTGEKGILIRYKPAIWDSWSNIYLDHPNNIIISFPITRSTHVLG